MLARGTTPSVEVAADAAGISRATAYRYFPNRQSLLVATYPEIGTTSLLGDDPPTDVVARLDLLTQAMTRQMLDHETELRTMLRLSLEPDPPDLAFRKGRRPAWVEDALAPLRDELPEDEFRRLVVAIAAGLGIEAFVWLTDMGGLSRTRAAETMRWTARTLLRGALGR